jgi:hypothetical protein
MATVAWLCTTAMDVSAADASGEQQRAGDEERQPTAGQNADRAWLVRHG